MYLKEVNEVPIRRDLPPRSRTNNQLKRCLLDFYNSDIMAAEIVIDSGEYASPFSLYSGLQKAIKNMDDLPVAVEMVRGAVYLRRTDYD